jgi:hypothetical protein
MGFIVLPDREQTMIEREVKKILNNDVDRSSESSAAVSNTTSIAVSKASVSVVSAFFQSVGHDSNVSKDKRSSLADELRRYRLLASKATDSTDDHSSALQFWSMHGGGLPLLSSLARRFLAIPGTSVSSETAFSVSSFIGRKERCRLTTENLAATMFLRDKILST